MKILSNEPFNNTQGRADVTVAETQPPQSNLVILCKPRSIHNTMNINILRTKVCLMTFKYVGLVLFFDCLEEM